MAFRSPLPFCLLALVALSACVRNPPAAPPAVASSSPAGVPSAGVPARTVPPPPARTTLRTAHRYPFPQVPRTIDLFALDDRSHVRTWRGLRLAPRERCPAYDASFYGPVSHPPRLPERIGRAWRDPLTCSWFEGTQDPDFVPARLVSPGVAHDAGLCSAPAAVRQAFVFDPENTVYLPRTVGALRRYLADVGGPQWLPDANQCWYAQAQLRIRRRYRLSITPDEARALESILRTCGNDRVTPYCGSYGPPPSWP